MENVATAWLPHVHCVVTGGGLDDDGVWRDAREGFPAVACVTNPGAPCRDGVTDYATGVEVCVDAMPLADGTICPTGVCVAGERLGSTDVSFVAAPTQGSS